MPTAHHQLRTLTACAKLTPCSSDAWCSLRCLSAVRLGTGSRKRPRAHLRFLLLHRKRSHYPLSSDRNGSSFTSPSSTLESHSFNGGLSAVRPNLLSNKFRMHEPQMHRPTQQP